MEKAYILFYQQQGGLAMALWPQLELTVTTALLPPPASTPPTLPEVTASFDDPAEMRGVDQLLRLFKPHPSPASEAPPPLPPKRASSESGCLLDVRITSLGSELAVSPSCSGDLVGGSGESAHNSAIISALGLEPPSLLTDSSAPTLPPPLTRASSNPQLTSSTAAQFNVSHDNHWSTASPLTVHHKTVLYVISAGGPQGLPPGRL